MKKILIKFPSRSRPEKFFNCLDNITSTIGDVDYKILCTLDVDDVTMNTRGIYDRINSLFTPSLQTSLQHHALYGFSEGKIDAINRDMEYSDDWDIVLLHSDDFWYLKQDWGKDILEAFHNFSGLVHFPDQKAGRELITYPMMSRDYYELDGYIYHPGFKSVYADNYQMDVAIKRKMYKFVDKKILEHRHAIWGYGEPDELLKQTENPVVYAKDRETYMRLKGTELHSL